MIQIFKTVVTKQKKSTLKEIKKIGKKKNVQQPMIEHKKLK